MWSWNEKTGKINAKSTYGALLYVSLGEDGWWLCPLWKWNVPLKIKLFVWLDLGNHILTWDYYLKNGGVDPNSCPLCNMNVESMDHLLIHCTFTLHV